MLLLLFIVVVLGVVNLNYDVCVKRNYSNNHENHDNDNVGDKDDPSFRCLTLKFSRNSEKSARSQLDLCVVIFRTRLVLVCIIIIIIIIDIMSVIIVIIIIIIIIKQVSINLII